MNNLILNVDNISLNLPGVGHPILENVTYQINEGDFVILLGSNGSGKSSLLKVIDGRYKKSSGKITLHHQAGKKGVTTVTQSSADALFMPLTVYENFLLIADGKGTREQCQTYLQTFNPKLASKLDDLASRLSGGERQALVLALATYQPCDLLLLDEHTAALDPVTSERLMKLTANIITEKKLTCVMTTHDLDDALKFGNRILSLRHGRVHATIDEHEKNSMTVEKLLSACY